MGFIGTEMEPSNASSDIPPQMLWLATTTPALGVKVLVWERGWLQPQRLFGSACRPCTQAMADAALPNDTISDRPRPKRTKLEVA
jgi:hypothetical protein